ncbi:hypothetical protein APHAL10511_006823 [Amanita phalloides]|nr:hypothetical protein APHAL10511_006823 [Amanita phalloides]
MVCFKCSANRWTAAVQPVRPPSYTSPHHFYFVAMPSTSVLFKPLEIGDITIPNRITLAALTRNRALGTVPNDIIKDYYLQRADAGLIVTEGVLVSRQGSEWPHAPGIWNEEQVQEWKKIVDAIHAVGGHVYCQLWCVGRVCHPDAPEQKLAGVPVWGPSAIAARGGKFRHIPGMPGYVTPVEIPDPWTIVDEFRKAAFNAKAAGFDGVEMHGANGYIISQFLDNTVNKRTDEWGGSVENRCRLGLEIIKAVKEAFGRNVAIKLSPCGGYNDMGMSIEDTLETFGYFILEADELGLAYICLLRYISQLDYKYDGQPRSTYHDVLGCYGRLIKNCKVMINGNVLPEEGAQLINAGLVDFISIGIPYISHPDLVRRVKYGKLFNNALDIPHMQWVEGRENQRIGYTDYPEAHYEDD